MGFLRLFLALSVAAAHADISIFGFGLLNSTAAVYVFFCISGFLITLALCKGNYQTGHWLAAFYVNRALRIYPLYWLTALATIALGYSGLVDIGINFNGGTSPLSVIAGNYGTASGETRALIWFTNLTTVFQDTLTQLSYDPPSGEFVTDPRVPPRIWAGLFELLGQSWTLGVEIIFYLFAPLVVRSPTRILAALLVCAACAYFAQHPEGLSGLRAIVSHADSTAKYLPFFLVGSCLCHLFVLRMAITLPAIGLALSVLLMATVSVAKLGALTSATVITLTFLIPLLFAYVKSKNDNFLGDLSYPIYITHFLVMQISRQYCPDYAYPVIVVVAVMSVAIVTAIYIDGPIDRLRHGLGRALTSMTGGNPSHKVFTR